MGYKMITNIIAHLLLNEAIGAYSRKNAQKQMLEITKEVERYYMTFFGEIFLIDERNWILDNKIRPIISKMSGKELADIIKLRDKNNKLVKRGKPVRDILVDKATVERYHLEYHNFKREEARRRYEAAEKKRRDAENEKRYKDYVSEFGESEAEIAKKFFE